MKLSIIVPVYNCSKYLKRSLDSLVGQTIDDYELIIVNDGSTDDSQDIIDSYCIKHSFIKALIVENGGQGRARNIAMDIAQGDYIGFADADDYVSSDMFGKLVSLCQSTDSDIAVCDYYRFSGDDLRYEKAALQDHPLAAAGAVWNKVFRKSLVNDIRFPTGLWYEDLEFSAKAMLAAKKISYLPEPLYYYRSDNPSTMRNKNGKKNLDLISVFDNISDFLPSGSKDNYEFLLINHMLLESIKRVGDIGDRDSVRALRKYVKSYIPSLFKCRSFKSESRNRRIIMTMNYYGLDRLSAFILKLKK